MMKRLVSAFVCALIVLSLVPAAVGATGTFTEFTDYYGRNALSQLPNSTALLYAYDSIASTVASRGSTASVYDGSHPISTSEVSTVMDAYRRDHVEHFWLANGWNYSYNSTTVVSISPQYLMTASAIATAKTQIASVVADVFSGVDPSMDPADIELYFHDYLCDTITYSESTHCRNIYGALVEHVAVCEGYAEAFQYLLYLAGIPAFTAIGTSLNKSTGAYEGHEWTYVRLGGNWYHADVTWDDQGDDIYHEYLNIPTSVACADHTLNATSYALPVCDSSDAFYFSTKGATLSTYTVDSVAAVLRENGLQAAIYVPSGGEDFADWFRSNYSPISVAAGIVGAYSVSWNWLRNEVHLNYYVSPTGVSLPATLELTVGESAILTPSFVPANATERAVTWTVDDGTVVSVDQSGLVTALKEGSTTVTVTTDVGGFAAVCTVTATAPAIPVAGDVDGDGSLNARDVIRLMKYIVGHTAATDPDLASFDASLADFDGNGKINNRDILLMMFAIVNAGN